MRSSVSWSENRQAGQHGVSAQTIYSWRKHVGTLEPGVVA